MKTYSSRWVAFLAALAIGMALIGTGCPPEPPNVKFYTVTIAAGIENGTITANANRAEPGATISLTISPFPGYQLKGDVSVKNASGALLPHGGSGDRRTFTMPASDVIVSGEFESLGFVPLTTYAITVAAGIEHGTITANPAEAEEGATVTLTITPENGYRLKTVDVKDADDADVRLSGSGNTRTFTMPASNVAVSGEFEQQPYTITIPAIQNGTVTVTLPADKTEYLAGEAISLTITPNEGYELDTISATAATDPVTPVILNGTGAVRTFTMPIGNVTIDASFKGILYSISVTQPAQGSITATPTTAIIGTKIDLTLVPPPVGNFGLQSLTVTAGTQNIAVYGGGLYRYFTMPAANVTVTVAFQEITSGQTYTLTLPPTVPEGSITAAPTGPVYAGVFVKLSISPTTGYKLKSLSVKNTSNQDILLGASGNDRSFTMPSSNVTVTAVWEIITNTTITVTFDGPQNETINLTTSGTILNQNSSLSVQINGSYDGYEWYLDGTPWWYSGAYAINSHASSFTIGKHKITVVVWKNGVPYSKELAFEVVW